MNKKNFIIFTPLKYLLPKKSSDNLYSISEDPFNNHKDFSGIISKTKIYSHRWLNEKKIQEDSKYIFKLNKKIIKNLYKKLNSIHNKDYSEQFWYILISPWSLSFIQIIFDRWHAIETILKKNRKKKFLSNSVNFSNKENFVPLSTEEFFEDKQFFRSNFWNQNICQNIVKNFSQISFKKNKQKTVNIDFKKQKIKNFNIKSILFFLINNFFKIFSGKKNKYFIYKTYLGLFRELMLCARLGQVPFFGEVVLKFKRPNLNKKLRNSSFLNLKGKNKFEKFIYEIFLDHMPIVFLEKFSELEKSVNKHRNLPKMPEKIYSAMCLWENSSINYYCALKKEKNTKILYSQHGGTYGITKVHFQTKYELEIADKFLSYGWNTGNKKIIKFGNIHNLNKRIFNSSKKYLLFISNKRHKYETFLDSDSSWRINFINTVKFYLKFLFNLPDKIKKSTLIRTLPNSNLHDLDFFNNIKNNFKADNSKNIFKLYKRSKLIIHSINSTSLLETFYLNIPSIIILNKDYQFNKSGKKIFNNLKKNNVFFDNPIAASKFIKKIWNNGIDNWWFSNQVQRSVNNFNLTYSKKRTNVISDLVKLLKNK